MEVSLKYHMQRRSMLIKYKCHVCDKPLKEYNRCSFLSHFRQHAESSVVQLDAAGIEISAISAEDMQIGPLQLAEDKLETNCKTVASVETQTSPSAETNKCSECEAEVLMDLRTHFLSPSHNKLVKGLKCKACGLQFHSQCALSAHSRYHKKQKPYVCPECGKVYSLWSSFIVHLNYTCFHLARCTRYKCARCSIFFPTTVMLEVHIVTQHVKNVFKCGGCELACFNENSLREHKKVAHSQQKLNTVCFNQCLLCNHLIQRERLLHHVNEHISKNESWSIGYHCSTCKSFFNKKTTFATHKCYDKNKVLHMVQPDGTATKNKILYNCNNNSNNNTGGQGMKVIPKAFPIKRLSSPTLNSGSVSQSLKQYPAAKKSNNSIVLTNQNNIPKISVISTKSLREDKIMSKIVTSKTSVKDLPNGKVVEEKVVSNGVKFNKVIRKCISCNSDIVICTTINKDISELRKECYNCTKAKNNVDQSIVKNKTEYGSLRKLVTNKQTHNNKSVKELPAAILEKLETSKEISHRIAFNEPSSNTNDENGKFKCHICKKLISLKDTREHFSKEHTNFNLLTLTPMVEKIDIKLTGENDSFISNQQMLNKIKEEPMDIDNSFDNSTKSSSDSQESSKKRKKIKLTPKEKMSALIPPFSSGQLIPPVETKNDDAYSCFKCNFSCADREDFHSHIITHRTDNNSYQCMECGMCFIVQPSFEKHLFVSHGIKSVSNYIEDNKNCKPREREKIYADSSSSEEELIQNECSVCHEVFDTSDELDKHFRVHGMAFLLKKQRELRKAIA